MINSLIVAETFYSLQCEGRAIGTPAVFLRLGGCNLLCKSETWVCDTIEVWKKGKRTPFEDVLCPEYIEYLKRGAHLVITGGEPLIHQKAILQYIEWLKKEKFIKALIEIETNGTILPCDEINHLVDFWNVSPKLSNCGEPASKRINEAALSYFSRDMSFNGFGDFEYKSIFKFVIANEGDVQEILQDYGMLDMNQVMLMPAGATREELNITRPIVVEQCKLLCLRYSERLHIVIWDKKTGV